MARFAEPVRVDHPIQQLVQRLEAALTGVGPALLPVPANGSAELVASALLDQSVGDDTALLLPTSGSTGEPKLVEMSGTALMTSAKATHARIGPPGRWLLALPLTHIAGWQVLVRGLLSPNPIPARLDPRRPFSAQAFLEALDAHPEIRYTALVPAQLHRLLTGADITRVDRHPGPPAELAERVTILLGGSAAPGILVQRARDAGLHVVTTYGSSETSGGCLYDGYPLAGVRTALRPDGRLALAGRVLASGYRGRPDDPAFECDADGRRWFVTSDLAQVASGGQIRILGRADDVIVTGGENVHPAQVERALTSLPDITDAVVVGAHDPEWGQQVVALVSARDGLQPDRWRRELGGQLPRYAWPRRFIAVDQLPHLGIGKPDRRAAAALAAEAARP